jgi:ectoine hydroxylase-related dioxygenase (phytanoyl-CoA dioxygenase family)
MTLVADRIVDDYLRDGAVVLRGVLTGDEVQRLRAGVDAVIAAPSARAVTDGEPGAPGTFFEDFCTWQHVPEFERVIRESGLAAAAGRLMGSREVRMFHDHILVKEPGTTTKTPWHQDQPFYCIDGSQTVSFWVPLDPVARESTLEFVAGSNSGTWYMPRSFFSGDAFAFDEGTLEEVPDVEADRSAFPIVGWALEPGDAVAFNMLTLHAAAGSATRRRAFSLRLLGDDVRYAPRAHRTSPSFPGLEDRLDAGAPMDDPLFPLLWPRAGF